MLARKGKLIFSFTHEFEKKNTLPNKKFSFTHKFLLLRQVHMQLDDVLKSSQVVQEQL